MPDNEPPATPSPSSRPWRRRARLLAMISLIALLAGELFARFYLGLGNPPLTITHPTIEYLFAPNQQVRRFGNRFHTNSYSMRSASFPREKEDPNELRILVLGDSIINGGTLTDQEELATELLRRDLAERLMHPVIVGNISAGSWGPPNLLAYIKEFGTFDADIAVLVLSSHDAADVPTFEPLNPNGFPQSRPPSALWEAINRYLPRYLPGKGAATDEALPAVSDSGQAEALNAVRSLIETLRQAGLQVLVLQHQTRAELAARPEAGHGLLSTICEEAGANVLQLGPALKKNLDGGVNLYRDDGLHPNAAGQRVIYEVMRDEIIEQLRHQQASSAELSAPQPWPIPHRLA